MRASHQVDASVRCSATRSLRPIVQAGQAWRLRKLAGMDMNCLSIGMAMDQSVDDLQRPTALRLHLMLVGREGSRMLDYEASGDLWYPSHGGVCPRGWRDGGMDPQERVTMREGDEDEDGIAIAIGIGWKSAAASDAGAPLLPHLLDPVPFTSPSLPLTPLLLFFSFLFLPLPLPLDTTSYYISSRALPWSTVTSPKTGPADQRDG
ncbi:hypothetical protein BO78DRAFT_82507 [Aspergillus sclerotiicarbonarius CBS 121057]|uniref:Uncharacterized protein n=1 Tax=Aspergillus sclerotiicarbonarius (strain CBS 121057 / IBT 28362) TaxID=1448318 RepID=A0A319EED7_ASPSB|nr:hypothetical protein BO78DRAFT_82507 [Aspergillus sclerotiicarbonarius CBS 121057]